ncbi:patatin-like phospholipase family protein [Methylovirgula sp. 4M-Z18]|uniref:patatin-like phospholipase family protein n=1 Tax=Methylovirgula sp. 4M-Z18 TaxID=2293567 RepID=UPI001AECB200|nr:patatin-like phospholipase family protein [Methylovirgula sp. 4M-Z18]
MLKFIGKDAAPMPFWRSSTQSGQGASKKPFRVSLALQGGGSFGAFTWGVLDRLLEEDDVVFDAISCASAGTVNAVALASGLALGGREGARAKLAEVWRKISASGAPGMATLPIASYGLLSASQWNMFDINPLRTILNDEIDFAAIRESDGPQLLIAATRLSDSRARIFSRDEVSAEVVLASACLPRLNHTVVIDDEAYWDGGYAANPPLIPLVTQSKARDFLVVQIVPTRGAKVPVSAEEIGARLLRLQFGSGLLEDLDALQSLQAKRRKTRWLAQGKDGELSDIKLHLLAAEECHEGLAEASPLSTDWNFITALKESGRAAAEQWLQSQKAPQTVSA